MSKALRLASSLKELRIHLCQTGESSKGVREFIQKQYVSLKRENPKLPILVRECSGIQPRLWARMEEGKECSVSLCNMDSADVLKQVETISSRH